MCCPAAGCRSARCTRCWAPGPTRKTARRLPGSSPESWPGSAPAPGWPRRRTPRFTNGRTNGGAARISPTLSGCARLASRPCFVRCPALSRCAASPIFLRRALSPIFPGFALSLILARLRKEAAGRPGRKSPGLGTRQVGRREIGPGSGLVLWCLKRHDLYGPGLLAHGLDPARVVLVTARRGDEVLWVVEEALRAGPEAGLAAVVGEIGRLPMVAGRRLQLAAERSGVTAFLLRRWRGAAEAVAERERPSAALTRWRITALPSTLGAPFLRNPLPQWGRGGEIAATGVFGTGLGRPRWRVELLRVRGGAPGSWEVEIADATGHVRLSAGLADRPAAPQRPHSRGCGPTGRVVKPRSRRSSRPMAPRGMADACSPR